MVGGKIEYGANVILLYCSAFVIFKSRFVKPWLQVYVPTQSPLIPLVKKPVTALQAKEGIINKVSERRKRKRFDLFI